MTIRREPSRLRGVQGLARSGFHDLLEHALVDVGSRHTKQVENAA